MPQISIGVPVYNGERYLAEALASIAAQDFTDFEVLVSDNASNDNTARIAQDFCNRDPRFRYHRQDRNIGAAGNFNFVFHNTTGPYFRWAAHDDMIAPGYLRACHQALEQDRTGAVLAYPQTLMIDETGAPLRTYAAVTRKGGQSPARRLHAMLGPGDPHTSLIHMCFPVFGLIRRRALQGTSLIANMPRSDHLLLVELALRGAFIELDAPLFLRREHDAGSVIAAERAASGAQVEKLLAAWFDPTKGKRFPATTTRLGLGYLRAVLRTPMPLREKAACLTTTLGWLRRHWRVIGGECKIVTRESLPWRGQIRTGGP